MVDLFESTKRPKTPEERRGIPTIEVIREAVRGEYVEGCNQEWISCALEVLDRNHIHSVVYSEAVRNVLVKGRGKNCNIILGGPANCGKTLLFAPPPPSHSSSVDPRPPTTHVQNIFPHFKL